MAQEDQRPLAFTDTEGNLWDVTVTVDTIRRVRSRLGVDLMDAAGGKVIDQLGADPILLADVIYVVCAPEAERRGISDEDFGRALRGDVIAEATEAFLEALVSFFPDRRDRDALRKVLQASRDATERLRDRREAKMTDEALREVADAAVARAIEEERGGNSSTIVPE